MDGVSLTLIDVRAEDFSVGLIPTTQQVTTLGMRRPGELVNLEIDVIAKYVERLARPHLVPGSDGAGG
jgi:riboflavin synthase